MNGTWVNELIMLYPENPGFSDIVLLAIYSGSAVDPPITTTYAISAYHHWCCGFDSRSGRVYNIMWWSWSVTCGRSVVFSGSSTNRTDRHDITGILLKVALNTIEPTNFSSLLNWFHSFIVERMRVADSPEVCRMAVYVIL